MLLWIMFFFGSSPYLSTSVKKTAGRRSHGAVTSVKKIVGVRTRGRSCVAVTPRVDARRVQRLDWAERGPAASQRESSEADVSGFLGHRRDLNPQRSFRKMAV